MGFPKKAENEFSRADKGAVYTFTIAAEVVLRPMKGQRPPFAAIIISEEKP